MDKHFTSCQRGFVITFENGWCIDAAIGPGSYSENYYESFKNEVMESDNCETIIKDNTGRDCTLEISKILMIFVSGDKRSAVLPHMKFADWLKVFDYVRKQERV